MTMGKNYLSRRALPLLALWILNSVCNGHPTISKRVSRLFPSWSSPFHVHDKRLYKSNAYLRSLLLPRTEKDPCLKFMSNKEQSECLQPVLETYYGKYINAACPQFSLVLSLYRCGGCPWERVDPAKVTQLRNVHLPLQPEHLYFRNASADCRIAEHVVPYGKPRTVLDFVFKIGLIVSGLLVVLSVLGACSGSQNGVLKPVRLYGWKVPEPVYLGILFLTFDAALLLHAITADYYRYCESLSSIHTQSQIVVVSYATTLSISLSRCLRLPHEDASTHSPSWYSFAVNSFWGTGRQPQRRTALTGIIAGFLIAFMATFVMEVMTIATIEDSKRYTWCVAGQRDYTMGLVQYSKLVLEFISVTVYALGPQRRPLFGRMRYATLSLTALLSWIACALYKPNGHSMLIPRILDQIIAEEYVEVMHINIVSFLGLFELLRPDCQALWLAENQE